MSRIAILGHNNGSSGGLYGYGLERFFAGEPQDRATLYSGRVAGGTEAFHENAALWKGRMARCCRWGMA